MHHTHFNPRSHKGSDRFGKNNRSALRHFNPRSHKGSDSNISQKNAFVSRNIINISKFVLKILPHFPLFKTNLNFLFIILGANLPAVLCALYTRTHCLIKLEFGQLQFPCLLQYVPLSSDIYFPDSITASCLHLHL